MGRSNLTVVKDEQKNPTPWKEPRHWPTGQPMARGGVIGNHPAGSGIILTTSRDALVKKLQEGRDETLRTRLRTIHAQHEAELESELRGMIKQHETEALLLDYRLDGNTLEGLGDLAEDEVIADAWTRLNEELFDQ